MSKNASEAADPKYEIREYTPNRVYLEQYRQVMLVLSGDDEGHECENFMSWVTVAGRLQIMQWTRRLDIHPKMSL